MAFLIRNLSVLAYANGFTLWHYKSAEDTREQISAANYMAGAADMLSRGDVILANATDGTRMLVVILTDVNTAITGPLS